MYLNPPIATPSFTTSLSINFILNFSWIFLFDYSFVNQNFNIPCLVFLIGIAVSNIFCMTILARNITKYNQLESADFWWGVFWWVSLNGLEIRVCHRYISKTASFKFEYRLEWFFVEKLQQLKFHTAFFQSKWDIFVFLSLFHEPGHTIPRKS